MSIGLISENKIREQLRKELNKDIKKFLDNGGKITRCGFDDHEGFEPIFGRFTPSKTSYKWLPKEEK